MVQGTAQPALWEAESGCPHLLALNCYRTFPSSMAASCPPLPGLQDIGALKALKNPPDVIKRIFDCVLLLR